MFCARGPCLAVVDVDATAEFWQHGGFEQCFFGNRVGEDEILIRVNRHWSNANSMIAFALDPL